MSKVAIALVALILIPAALHRIHLVDEVGVEYVDFVRANADDRSFGTSVDADNA